MRNARELFARNSNSTTLGCLVVFFFCLSFVRSEARARVKEEEEKKNERPLSNANEPCVCCVVWCVPSQSGENSRVVVGGSWALCVGAATNER